MVIIRLSRYGKRKKPFYHIKVSDSRRQRNGKFLEKIGFFDPFLSFKNIKGFYINIKKLKYWINKGAVLSKRVNYLYKKYKFINNL